MPGIRERRGSIHSESEVTNVAPSEKGQSSEEQLQPKADQSVPVDEAASEPAQAPAPPKEPEAPAEPEDEPLTRPGMSWYVLRVASNKEEQVREALLAFQRH